MSPAGRRGGRAARAAGARSAPSTSRRRPTTSASATACSTAGRRRGAAAVRPHRGGRARPGVQRQGGGGADRRHPHRGARRPATRWCSGTPAGMPALFAYADEIGPLVGRPIRHGAGAAGACRPRRTFRSSSSAASSPGCMCSRTACAGAVGIAGAEHGEQLGVLAGLPARRAPARRSRARRPGRATPPTRSAGTRATAAGCRRRRRGPGGSRGGPPSSCPSRRRSGTARMRPSAWLDRSEAIGVLGHEAGGFDLEHGADPVHVVELLGRELGHPHAPVGRAAQQSFVDELGEAGAERLPADVEPLGQLDLAQSRAGRDRAVEDLARELTRDGVARRRPFQGHVADDRGGGWVRGCRHGELHRAPGGGAGSEQRRGGSPDLATDCQTIVQGATSMRTGAADPAGLLQRLRRLGAAPGVGAHGRDRPARRAARVRVDLDGRARRGEVGPRGRGVRRRDRDDGPGGDRARGSSSASSSSTRRCATRR